MVDYVLKAETGKYTLQGSDVNFSVEQIIDAMKVVGFQDQGKEKVIELIQDKYQDLILGNLEVIPTEWVEQADIIMSIVEHLSKIPT
mmetsp:Transcript_3153/g.3028  ORF Transcript_3153/g.3028 Transcript_3153/m.3028 type:complete len:87 (+) Transcript_3153:371-631(+)